MILNCRAANGAHMTIVFSLGLRQQVAYEAEVLKRPVSALTKGQRRKAMSHRLSDSVVRRERQAHYRKFYKLETNGHAHRR